MKSIPAIILLISLILTGCVGSYNFNPLSPTLPYRSIFASANDFPIPAGSKIILKNVPAKGTAVSIALDSKLSLEQLQEFYSDKMTALGCEESSSYHGESKETRNLAYSCMHGYQQDVYINAVDMAYKSEKDVRMVSLNFQIQEK